MLDQAADEGLRGDFAREELAKIPTLTSYEQIMWDAFTTLSTERQLTGMGGIGPIPWSAIVRYASYHGFNAIEANDLVKCVATLDPIYIQNAADRASRAAKGHRSS